MFHIDFETRSQLDLSEVGVYRYAMHPSTEVLCAAFSWKEHMYDWTMGQPTPAMIADLPEATAWNAQFERTIWALLLRPRYGWPPVPRFFCTMARAGAHGLPMKLELAAKALGISQQKDMAGNALMRKMTKPAKVVDGRPQWHEKPEDLARLVQYCRQDVVTEMAVAEYLDPLSKVEQTYYELDQAINSRGVRVDRRLILGAIRIRDKAVAKANADLIDITGGAIKTVSQTVALTKWAQGQGAADVTSLNKQALADLDFATLPQQVADAIAVRQDAGKSSVAKYDTMLAWADDTDDRIRGLLQFNGAGTGRWAGRGFQPQNLPRPSMKNPEVFLPLLYAGDYEGVDLMASPMDVLSNCIRSAIVAKPGHRLVVADYNAIEARVLAWIAREIGLLDAFRSGQDAYKKLATAIYSAPLEAVTSEQRLLGKIAVLGLGYQMGPAKFLDTCKKVGGVTIEPEFSEQVVAIYRQANSQVVSLWRELQDGAMQAVRGMATVQTARGIEFSSNSDWLTMRLPSGRLLSYMQPRIVSRQTKWGMRESVEVSGQDGVTKHWGRYQLYGGLLVENLVQATARDLLAAAMLRLDKAGYPIVLTVHDEVIAEAPIGFGSVEHFEKTMCVLPTWATGCPVKAEGWEGDRYKK